MTAADYGNLTVLRRLMQQARPYWPHLAGVFLLDLLATPLSLLRPFPLKIAVDSVVGAAPLPGWLAAVAGPGGAAGWGTLALAAGMQILIVLLMQSQELAHYALKTYTGEQLTLNFRARIFRHTQRLSLPYHDSRGTADSLYRIQYDAAAINWITSHGLLPILSSTLMLLAMIYVMVRIDGSLALIALGITPLLVLYARAYDRRMKHRYRGVKELESRALKVVQEVLAAVRVVKAFGREDQEQERFVRRSREGVRERFRLALAEGGFGLLVNVTTALGAALVLLVGVRHVQSGVLTLGELLMVMAYLSQLYAPLETISSEVAGMQSSLASARRAFEVLDERPEVAEKPHVRALHRAAGEVEFRNVSFAYDGENPVLQNISFRAPAGTRVGISGRTGAGKTTLVSLLNRFYDPCEGQILIDGVDIREYRLADLRNQFAIVLQEPVLFSTSIAENISYARPGASQQEIVAAARAANAHDFIAALPDGYDTLVGERGMRLSGGERQRISLARAFLKDAPVLILDEPTSSVDIRTERGIIEAMERLMRGRTVFMIAHRLSTLDRCDLRLQLEAGRLMPDAPDVERDAPAKVHRRP